MRKGRHLEVSFIRQHFPEAARGAIGRSLRIGLARPSIAAMRANLSAKPLGNSGGQTLIAPISRITPDAQVGHQRVDRHALMQDM